MARGSVALRLGRVSNLPTTFSNVVAAAILAGGTTPLASLVALCVAAALLYTGGMYLNDAFDRDIDARERPERPIPSGQVRAGSVFGAGFGMLAAGVGVVAWLALGGLGGAPGHGLAPIVAALCLAGAIVLYDAYHKDNPLSPLLMAACRVLLYATAALSVSTAPGLRFAWGAVALLGYLIGLTYVAKQENLRRFTNRWPLLFLALPFSYVAAFAHALGIACYVALLAWVAYTLGFLWREGRRNVPRAVTQFIAGIALLDAMLAAGQGATAAVAFCIAAFALTLLFQRVVPGT